jgi:hypothetical protein
MDAGGAAGKIGRIDRYWAAWEGFDPEAYVMMKNMGERFSNLQRAASIARDSGQRPPAKPVA